MEKVLIASASDDGHRREYNALLVELFEENKRKVEVRGVSLRDVFYSGALLFPMVEEFGSKFYIIAAIRNVLRRPTAGLLFRPLEAIYGGSLRHFLKRNILRAVKSLGRVRVITILPFSLDPKFGMVANDWIYDPQLWDMKASSLPVDGPVVKEVAAAAKGRRVLVALGAQNEGKGFEYFTEIWGGSSHLRERFLFVAAGRVSQSSQSKRAAFEAAGGLVFDRFVSDREMLEFYSVGDLIWSCYSPGYDQASGIFGRAFQFGIPAVVRAGSLVERCGRIFGHDICAVRWGDAKASEEMLLTYSVSALEAGMTRNTSPAEMRSHSVSVLLSAIGIFA